MKVNREELVKALEIVKPGLANKELIEQSTSFAFMDGKIVTYNDSLSVSHPIKGLEIQGAIQATEFYALLNKLKATEINIEIKDNEILLKCGKSKAGMTLQEEIKLPLEEIAGELKWKKLPDSFVPGLVICQSVCSTDASRPLLTGVHCRPDGILEASDNMRIIRYAGKEVKIKACVIEATNISHIKAMKPTQVARTVGWIHFTNEIGTVLSCRVMEDAFLDLESLMKHEKIKELELPSGMEEALEKANVFAKRDHSVDEEVIITLSKKRLKIAGKSETGWYEEVAKSDYEGDDIEFKMTSVLLEDVIKKSNSIILCKDRVVIKTNEYDYLALLRQEIE